MNPVALRYNGGLKRESRVELEFRIFTNIRHPPTLSELRVERVGVEEEPLPRNKPINVAVVGAGQWGQNHVRQFAANPNAKLHTVCDLIKTRLESIQQKYPSVATTADLKSIINQPEIEAVVIASPAPLHYRQARDALLAGKHVLVEKPITLKTKEAEDLIKLAKETGRILMVGHLLLYHEAVSAIKKLVDGGEAGDVLYIYSQRLNLGIVRRDENCLWSLAPHDISVMLHLIGLNPVEVSAIGQCYLQPGVEDVVFCTLTFPNRIVAHLHISWLDPHKVRKFTIVGTKKMIVFDDMEAAEKVRLYDKGVGKKPDYQVYGEDLTLRFGDILIPSIKMREPLAEECDHFLDCIQRRKEPLTGGDNGLNVLKVLTAAQRSLDKNGTPVKID